MGEEDLPSDIERGFIIMKHILIMGVLRILAETLLFTTQVIFREGAFTQRRREGAY